MTNISVYREMAGSVYKEILVTCEVLNGMRKIIWTDGDYTDERWVNDTGKWRDRFALLDIKLGTRDIKFINEGKRIGDCGKPLHPQLLYQIKLQYGTLGRFSKACGCSRSHIYNLIYYTKQPEGKTIKKLCTLLRCTRLHLFNLPERQNPI